MARCGCNFWGRRRLPSMMEIPTPDAVEPNSPKTLPILDVAELRPPPADLAVFSVQLRSRSGKRPVAHALLFRKRFRNNKDVWRRVAMKPEQVRPIDEVLRRVQGEFLEMPGLRLTGAQARRLWGLDTAMCDALLGALVDAKFLFQTRDGAFMKVEQATPVRASLRPRYIGAA